MICVSITEYGYDACVKALKKCEKAAKKFPDIIAEIRLDLCDLSREDVRDLFNSTEIPLIATCHKRSQHLFLPAINANASYVDIDALSSRSVFDEVSSYIGRRKTKKILSYHNYNRTPSFKELKKIYDGAVSNGADIIKICTTAITTEDAERVLSLYDYINSGEAPKKLPLIAFAMGNKGSYSRMESLSLGASFMYCALTKKSLIAAGQLTLDKAVELLSKEQVRGNIIVPSSKSIAQRAILSAALAQGESEFLSFCSCKDIDAAVSVARSLGAKITIEGDIISVRGLGFPFPKKKSESSGNSITSALLLPETINLHVGESGLLSRLCIPIAAQLKEGVTITGEGNLLGREMYGCKDALEMFNAKCLLTSTDTLPAVVNGPLVGRKISISGRRGSQLISGLLMALPLSSKDSVITVENPSSTAYIDLTIDILRSFQIEMVVDKGDDSWVFNIPGKQKYQSVAMVLEGDWSSAANFVVLAALFGEITLRGLSLDSTQADKDIINIVRESGALVTNVKDGVHIKRGRLRAFDYDATQSPDLFPILAVFAAFCEGRSSIKGIDRLKNKETDRTKAICQELGRMGVALEVDGDVMIINGISPVRRLMEGKMLKGGNYHSFDDHRIAMAIKVASIGCKDKVSIEGKDCVNKSFPMFWEVFSEVYKVRK